MKKIRNIVQCLRRCTPLVFCLTLSAATVFVGYTALKVLNRDIYTLKYRGAFTINNSENFLNELSEVQKELDSNDTLRIEISSPGGYTNALNDVLFKVLNLNAKVHTYTAHYSNSAAGVLFAMGDKRTIRSDASLLFHFARYSIGNFSLDVPKLEFIIKHKDKKEVKELLSSLSLNVEDIERMKAKLEIENERLKGYLSSKYPVEVVNKLLIHGKDVVLNAEEALDLGVATDIEVLTLFREKSEKTLLLDILKQLNPLR